MGIPSVAFIGQGKLMLVRSGQPAEPVESQFIARMQERADRDRERHGWRGDNLAWNFRPGMGGQAFRGVGVPTPGGNGGAVDARFISVAAGRDGMLLYSIGTSSIGGLFEYDPVQRQERRLVHKAGFYAESLKAHPASGDLAFCVRNADGSSAIGIAGPDGSKHRLVTEGDSVDESPAWADGASRRIVFQSSGIARSADGFATDLTVSRVEVLDLDQQSMSVVVEDLSYDYLSPRLMADGTLYAIRRPYESIAPRVSPWKLLLDILLFPIRLVMTLVALVNVISIFIRGQPIHTAGGPQLPNADAKQIRLWGRWVDTKKVLAARSNGREQALVGSDWKLVRRTPDGAETVLADRVVHFDLCADGSIVYTNGSKIRHRAADGSITEIASGKLVERVAALEPRTVATAGGGDQSAGNGAGGS